MIWQETYWNGQWNVNGRETDCHVCRGGIYFDKADGNAVSYRDSYFSKSIEVYLGFRPALYVR